MHKFVIWSELVVYLILIFLFILFRYFPVNISAKIFPCLWNVCFL